MTAWTSRLSKTVSLDDEAVVVRGPFGSRRIPFGDIDDALVRTSQWFAAALRPWWPIPATVETLVAFLQNGLQIPLLRRRHFTSETSSPELWGLAQAIRQRANVARPSADLPDDVAAQVADDLSRDDRPWWAPQSPAT